MQLRQKSVEHVKSETIVAFVR